MKINWKNIHYLILITIIFNFILLYYLKESSLNVNENEKIINKNETIFLLKKKNFPETKINPNDSVSQVAESIGAQGKVPQTTYLIENNTNFNNNNINNEENNLIHIILALFSIILTIFIINFLVELGEKQKKTFSNNNNNNNNENSVTNYILMDEEELI
jgi:predicted permease